ncbi:hypothetical protein V2J09_008098 [Rumex salicifolius]
MASPPPPQPCLFSLIPFWMEVKLRREKPFNSTIYHLFDSVVGSGIFTITAQEANNHIGPSIALAYAVSGSFTLIFAFCYAEFSDNVLVADNSFSFLRIELGDLAPFLTFANILLEVVSAAELATIMDNNEENNRLKRKLILEGKRKVVSSSGKDSRTYRHLPLKAIARTPLGDITNRIGFSHSIGAQIIFLWACHLFCRLHN